MKLIIHKGRPEDVSGRLEKEIRTYDLLDSLNITYQRIDHTEAATTEACKDIDETLYPTTICKNLFLCNSQQTKFYILMMPSYKKFKTKDVSRQIGSSRLSFAPENYMEEFLDITPGSVSVMGLQNDKDNRVQLLVDEDLLKDDYIGCHPCINTSSIKLKRSDLFDKVLPAMNHDMICVKVAE